MLLKSTKAEKKMIIENFEKNRWFKVWYFSFFFIQNSNEKVSRSLVYGLKSSGETIYAKKMEKR